MLATLGIGPTMPARARITTGPGPQPQAMGLPSDFVDEAVFGGLTEPTQVEFASDGRVFVAEKSGLIKVFSNLADTTPSVFADLRTKVHNFWDRGLLGMELDPNFPATPRVYVIYTHDAAIGGTAPRWGTAGQTGDGCPTPPGATDDGCVVSGRISALTASGDVSTGEQVLVEDWCQQYPSHSIGDLAFGPDGALYASGGDGASFNYVDYGQDGSPVNPCGDPPGGPGTVLTPPTAEGGALRAQDLRTSGDPVTLDGTVIRIDPATGLVRFSHFQETLRRDLAMARRDRRFVTILVFEIVEFAVYRQTFGDKAADSCQRMIGTQIMRALRRAGDICARYDETTLVAAVIGQHASEVQPLTERIADGVAQLRLHNPRAKGSRYIETRVILIGCPPGAHDDPEPLIERALAEARGANLTARVG